MDYRGFDTLCEITVMAIAALVIHALLADWQPTHRLGAPPNPSDSHPLMLALVSQLLLPLTTVVALYLLLRGHNLPGGGFIAGLVLAIGLLLQFVANGQSFVGQRMPVNFQPMLAWGLLIAGASGMGSWFLGAPFLTSTYDYPVWPLVGEVPLASAAVFDLGVFLTVVGATMVALLSVARLTTLAPSTGATAALNSNEKRGAL